MKRKTSLPFFDRVHSTVVLGTSNSFDHGWMIVIARDPFSGCKNRYSVLTINCQTNRIHAVGRELDLKLAKEIQKRHVKLFVSLGGTDPKLITGWCKQENYQYE